MTLLTSLGINSSFFLHFLCFAVSYIFLYFLVFRPYSAAMMERKRRTQGQEAQADAFLAEATELQSKFETKARDLNSKVAAMFDASRKEAAIEADRLLEAADTQAQSLLLASRTKLTGEVLAAREALNREAPAVASSIATRVSGREMSL